MKRFRRYPRLADRTQASTPLKVINACIKQQVAREEQELKQQKTFTFTELQTILYALGRTSRYLDLSGRLRVKVQTMRDKPENPGSDS